MKILGGNGLTQINSPYDAKLNLMPYAIALPKAYKTR